MIKKLIWLLGSVSYIYALNCSSVTDVKEYNGHYYTITKERLSFLQAKQFAESNGGYLAIPNNSAENDFLKSLIPTPKYAWIGVYDPNYMSNYCYEGGSCLYDDSRFRDIKRNALIYTNWANRQPDNLVKSYDIYDGKQLVSPLGEHWVAMSSIDGKWADFGNHADDYNNPVKFYALIEFDNMPECYTPESNVTDTYSGAKCNTQIYDSTTGTLSSGETYTCLQDPNGVYYCPAGLATCGETWDYKDGYSVKKTNVLYTGEPIKTTYTTLNDCKNDNNQLCVKANITKDIKFTLYYDSTPHEECDKVKVVSTNFGHTFDWRKGLRYNDIDKIVLDYMGISYNYIVDSKDFKNWLQDVYENYDGDCKRGKIYGPKDIVIKINMSEYEGLKCNVGKLKNSKCYLEYSYYTYLCEGTNEYGETYEPTNEGGDCNPQDESDLIDTDGDGVADSCNSPTPPPNNCKAQSFTCVPAPDRKCVYVDNQWQCSPYPCFGEGAGDYNVTNADTPVGINDANNNGWNSDGSCTGELYIFNGKDMRCRSDDAFFGLTGGGCCDKDKVFLGLVQCKEDEKILARKNNNEMCHYIGEYCSKKLDLLVGSICIQHKKTYCCFNSKLARIINEQGRVQIGKSWGTTKEPDCKGFTPEEFQKLDFSKMDLSEFYKDISQSLPSSVVNNMTDYIKNSINSQLQSIQH